MTDVTNGSEPKPATALGHVTIDQINISLQVGASLNNVLVGGTRVAKEKLGTRPLAFLVVDCSGGLNNPPPNETHGDRANHT